MSRHCPACGAWISWLSQRCAHCGQATGLPLTVVLKAVFYFLIAFLLTRLSVGLFLSQS